MKAELQTSTSRFVLQDTTRDPIPSLLPGQTSEFLVSHEIKELGVHVLLCTIYYLNARDEKQQFRKLYKFQVSQSYYLSYI